MMTRAKIVTVFCATTLLAALAAAPASAAPALDLQMSRITVPVTHSDERLAYQLEVSNTGSAVPNSGDVLSCNGTPAEGIHWFGANPAPSFEYQWLRDGKAVGGAGGPWPASPAVPTYTLTAADEGKSIQCMVTGTSDPDGAGTKYAPIGSAIVSSPPVLVAPVPSPVPPSGTRQPEVSGSVIAATPSGFASTKAGSNVLGDVITTKGTGTLTAGSKLVTGVSTAMGTFSEGQGGQTITGEGVPAPATGTGTAQFGSNVITGVVTSTGTFTVGEKIRVKTPTQNFTNIALTITAVGSSTLELSSAISGGPPGESLAVSLYAYTTITSVGPSTLELSAPATLSGPRELSAGASPFYDGQAVSGPGIPAVTATGSGNLSAATGTGNTTAGKNVITGVTTSSGAFAVGQSIELDQGDFTITALSPGTISLNFALSKSQTGVNLRAASRKVTGLSTSTGKFSTGQLLAGPGITPGTRIAKVLSATELELSAPPSQAGAGVGITAKAAVVNVEGLNVELSDAATATQSNVEINGTSEMTCIAPSGWTGTAITWSFQWLRNGKAIEGANTATYTPTKADTEPASLIQCEAIAKDAAGSQVAVLSEVRASWPDAPAPYLDPIRGGFPRSRCPTKRPVR